MSDTAVSSMSRNRAAQWCWRVLRWVVLSQALVAGLAILLMIVVTCVNVVMTRFNRPIAGVDDIVRFASAVAIACSLPYTTAVKGHVAIEFFFHKLGRRGRVVVDTIVRLLAMTLFALLCWRSFTYALQLKQAGQVSMTREMPLFWIPLIISLACATVIPVVLFNLLHPGREMIKP